VVIPLVFKDSPRLLGIIREVAHTTAEHRCLFYDDISI